MTQQVAHQLCEVEGCDKPALGYVEAQWSVADFDRYEVCEDCMPEVQYIMEHRFVDGLEPVVVYVGYYA